MMDVIHVTKNDRFKKSVGQPIQHSKDLLIIAMNQSTDVKVNGQVIDVVLSQVIQSQVQGILFRCIYLCLLLVFLPWEYTYNRHHVTLGQ